LKLSALKSKYITVYNYEQNDSRFSATGFLTSFLALMAPFLLCFFRQTTTVFQGKLSRFFSGSFVQRQKRIAIYHVKKFVKDSQL
jgi:hypothetical protein